MKRAIAFLLALLLALSLSTVGFADSAQVSIENQMVDLVKNFLDANDYPYEYEDYTFSTMFAIYNSMEYADVRIFIYDDMLSVAVEAPVQGTEDIFENMAIFTTLANSGLYYAQFRVELYDGVVYVACRSCNLVEDVVPGENELFYLISEPLSYMETYGDGIRAVMDGGDPYEAFEACQATEEAQ